MDSASRIQEAVQTFTSRLFLRKPKAVLPPVLSHPVRYPFGEFEFHLQSPSGRPVELQVSRDFENWETIDSFTPAKDLSSVSDKKAGNYPALFYRAKLGELLSNYLGFLTVDMPPGYSMIANPLRGASCELTHLFPSVPNESTFSKFNLATFALDKSLFKNGKWSHPAETLNPGEGALFRNPTDGPISARFVGEVPREPQTLPVQTGTSMRSSSLPLSGRLDTDLQFPIAIGDVVSFYSNSDEKYLEFKYGAGGWLGDPPRIRLGEAFWVAKSSPADWNQSLPVANSISGP